MRQRQKGNDVNRINATQILPIAMILLAAAVSLWHKDYGKAVHWMAAAVLNATVTILTHAERKPNARERKTSINRAKRQNKEDYT